MGQTPDRGLRGGVFDVVAGAVTHQAPAALAVDAHLALNRFAQPGVPSETDRHVCGFLDARRIGL
jgi:hypothetical protein